MNQAATTVRNRRTVQSVSLQDNGKKRCVFDALTRRYGVNAVGDCRNERVACRSESSYSSAAAAAWTAASVVNSRPVVALNGYEWSVVTDLQCGRAGRGSRGGTPTGLYRLDWTLCRHCHGYASCARRLRTQNTDAGLHLEGLFTRHSLSL